MLRCINYYKINVDSTQYNVNIMHDYLFRFNKFNVHSYCNKAKIVKWLSKRHCKSKTRRKGPRAKSSSHHDKDKPGKILEPKRKLDDSPTQNSMPKPFSDFRAASLLQLRRERATESFL